MTRQRGVRGCSVQSSAMGQISFFAHRMMRLWPGDGWSILNTGRPFSTTAVRAMTCCKLVTSSDTSPDHLLGARGSEKWPGLGTKAL